MTPAQLQVAVQQVLAAGVTPEQLAGARRRLGHDAAPAQVVTELRRQLRLDVSGDVDGGAELLVHGVGMPQRLAATWEQGGPLWVRRRGTAAGEGRTVAVVGTRRPTLDGVRTAERIAGDLAAAGVVVVSGLARGIDQAAHRGALAAGGTTTAVIGTGHDIDYPAGSAPLRRAVEASGGLISEYAPGRGIRRKDQFLARNRILAGLADATLVVEAGARSGALSSAGWAQAFGRDVLVVPSSPANAAAAGSLALLVDGATPVRHAADVLDALGSVGDLAGSDAPDEPPEHLDPVSRDLLPLIGAVPASTSALASATGHPPREVLIALSVLEERGLIAHDGLGVVRS